MSTLKENKLKKVLEEVPAGFLVDSSWLAAHGVSRFLTRKYVDGDWLERLSRGVFRRPAPGGSRPGATDWQTCLLSVQHIMGYKVHVGAMTALALQGHSHYLQLGGRPVVWLYGQDFPKWLSRLPLNARTILRSSTLFDEQALGLVGEGVHVQDALPWDWRLNTSSPERAVLEAMDELPENESFHNLDKVFEGLVNLRPQILAALLASCQKIKVRRLFFVFADRHGHAWRKRLDSDDYDLGSGDRALVTGGKIHPRYRIMVPADFVYETSDADHGA